MHKIETFLLSHVIKVILYNVDTSFNCEHNLNLMHKLDIHVHVYCRYSQNFSNSKNSRSVNMSRKQSFAPSSINQRGNYNEGASITVPTVHKYYQGEVENCNAVPIVLFTRLLSF